MKAITQPRHSRTNPKTPYGPNRAAHWRLAVRRLACLFTALFVLGLTVPPALADKLTLKDGSVLEGTIIKQTDRYWVKTSDGESRIVPADDVASFVKSTPTASPHPASGADSSANSTPAPAPRSSLASIERKAEQVDVASSAVKIWKDYLATDPTNADDVKHAREQLARWTAMAGDNAERINGKWIAGDEHKKLVESAGALFKEAIALLQKNETLKAVHLLEESQKMYPNSFVVNFLLGYMAFSEDNMDKALPYFEAAAKIRPTSAEAQANIGLIYFKKNQFEKGILQVERAAELADTLEIAYDLNVVVNIAPETVKASRRIKPAVEAAHLLASKYGMPPEVWKRGILPVPLREKRGGEGDPPAGAVASGTGFVIAGDGLILTNRHVVKGGKTFQVVLQGGAKTAAEVVVVDDEQDLALIRIKPAKPLSTVQFSDHDAPGDGAECTVIGFPLGDRFSSSPKVTHGIVTSAMKTATDGADVMIDAKVNPGNSGGPILDKSGHVMAIVSMKSLSSQTEDSYGLGISAGKIRRFLDKNKVKTQAAPVGDALSVEDIAAKTEPVTVLIITTF